TSGSASKKASSAKSSSKTGAAAKKTSSRITSKKAKEKEEEVEAVEAAGTEVVEEAPDAKTTKAAKTTSRKSTKAKKTSSAAEEKQPEKDVEKANEKSSKSGTSSKSGRKSSSKKTSSKKSSSKKEKVQVVEDDGNGGKRLIVDPTVDKDEYVKQAINDPDILKALIDSLCGENRRARQFSATIAAAVTHENPEVMVPNVGDLIDALHRPEAQTRWEILDALYDLVPMCKDKLAKAIDGAEQSLYDEDSGLARLSSFKFLCKLGAQEPKLSKKVWPDIDEAIQCYHGDIEFQDMLGELLEFSRGDIDKNVKKQLVARMKFDADNGKGALQHKAAAIVEAASA
ncbi:MAG: hypothetical protein ACOYIK_01510, partial [Coriobacteriales bacterium]